MGLIGNYSVLNKSHARWTNGTATAGAYAANNRANAVKPSCFRSRQITWSTTQSLPDGYNNGKAIFPPLKSGGIASQTRISGSGTLTATGISARLSDAALEGTSTVSGDLSILALAVAALSGSGDLNATILAVSSLASGLSGSGAISADLSSTLPMIASLAGIASLSPNLTGTGELSADITPFTELSPENLAASVWAAAATDNNESGTMGEKLNDAGGAGNPWASLLADNGDPGTFGERVQQLLTVAKFLGLK